MKLSLRMMLPTFLFASSMPLVSCLDTIGAVSEINEGVSTPEASDELSNENQHIGSDELCVATSKGRCLDEEELISFCRSHGWSADSQACSALLDETSDDLPTIITSEDSDDLVCLIIEHSTHEIGHRFECKPLRPDGAVEDVGYDLDLNEEFVRSNRNALWQGSWYVLIPGESWNTGRSQNTTYPTASSCPPKVSCSLYCRKTFA